MNQLTNNCQGVDQQYNSDQLAQVQENTHLTNQSPPIQQNNLINNSPLVERDRERDDLQDEDKVMQKKQKTWFKEIFCCRGSRYTIDNYQIDVLPNFGIHSICFSYYTIQILKNNKNPIKWQVNKSKGQWKIYQGDIEIVYYPPQFQIIDFRNENERSIFVFKNAKWCGNAKILQGNQTVAEFTECSKIKIISRNLNNLLLVIPIVVFIDQQNLQFFR